MSIAVAFAIGEVVAIVVAHQIVQAKAVVRDDEVDRLGRHALALAEQVRRGTQALRKPATCAISGDPETTHVVAEAVVPFRPAGRKTTDLVATGADVPRLGNHLHARQQRVLGDRTEERAVAVEACVATAQHRRQVETKTIDMHLADPVAQAVHHHLQHPWLAQVERVAAASVVFVLRRVVGCVAAGVSAGVSVIARVVEPTEADRRPVFVAFGAVVVDHVEDHFDAVRVQPLDHAAELVAVRLAAQARCQPRVGAEKADRVVAPVVRQAHPGQAQFIDTLVHRQQAHRRDAQALQVGEGSVGAQSRVAAAHRFGHAGVQLGESLDMQFVEHGVGQWRVQRPVVTPIEMVVDDTCLQRMPGVVVHVQQRRVPRIDAGLVAAPFEATDDLARIRVEQQLVGVEAVTLVGLPRPAHPQPVHQPRRCVGQVAVPDIVAVARQRRARQLAFAGRVEQAQLDAQRVRRKDREVDAAAVEMRAQRPGLAEFQRGFAAAAQAVHSKMTVASGGKSSCSECDLPCQPMASAVISPKGAPTLLPP